MKDEIWKDISGYIGQYQISNYGNVRSLSRTITIERKHKTYSKHYVGQLIKKRITRYGYIAVNLKLRSKTSSFQVHRLVAKAFLIKRENADQVNHIDLNKKNNHVSNLEWVTSKENIHHAKLNGAVFYVRGERSGLAKINSEKVKNIRKMAKNGFTIASISRLFKLSPQHTANIINKKSWAHIE